MFLRNYWYVAAWDREIGRKPLARTILSEPIVFYRQENGTPVALEDRCRIATCRCRWAGFEGDTLQCHYHGLRFDGTGAACESRART